MKMNYFVKYPLSIVIIIATLILTDCNSFRTSKILNKGFPDNNRLLTSIPFTIRGNNIFIKAHINNSNTEYNLLLSTVGWTSISKELAEKLSIQSIEETNTVDSSGAKTSILLTILNNISIGNTKVTNCASTIEDLKQMYDIEVDGILGSNFLRFYKVIIDYQNKTISFTRNIETTIDNDDIIVPIHLYAPYGFAPKAQCKIDDLTTVCYIDTNYAGYLTMSDSYISKLKNDNNKKMISLNEEITSETNKYKENKYLFRINSLKIKNTKFTELPILSHSDRIPYNSLGNEFLSNFIVTINYPDGKLILKPITKISKTNYQSYGLKLTKKNDKVFVTGIWNNSPADREGIKIGDEILLINSKNANEFSLFKMYDIFSDKNSDTIELVFTNGEIKKTIKLKKENLLPDIQ